MTSISFSEGDDIQLKGATDATLIGNVSNRLLVDIGSSLPATFIERENPTFFLISPVTAIGNNKSMLSLLNAGGSTVKIKIREIYIINTRNTPVTGVVAIFNTFRITGHSAGTVLTPTSYDTADALNVNVTARTGATIAGEGTALLKTASWSSDEWNTGALDQEGYDHAIQATLPIYQCKQKMKPITLNAGEGFTIKHVVNSVDGVFDIVVLFTQELT